MSAKQTALLIGKIVHARNTWEGLSNVLVLKEYGTGTREDFLYRCKTGEYDNVSVIYRSNASTTITGLFDSDFVSHLPPSLKFICHNGAGYDNIDVDACSKRGILISCTPGTVNNATADIAIFLMIGALRQAQKPLSGLREGRWRGDFTLGHDPNERILGILGMGGIGKEVAIRAKSFGMHIRYHNRTRLSLEIEKALKAEYVSFDDLIAQSDVLSLNLSLNANTKHILSSAEFAKMKTGVVIVNTARGGLIDEDAMIAGLESGKIYSAGLDVYDDEPRVNEAIRNNPNVFLLPHIGTATYETQKIMEEQVLDNVRSAILEGKLITPIVEQQQLDNKM